MAIIIGNQTFSGNSIVISGNKVIIDGVDVTKSLPDQKKYKIEITGNLQSLQCDSCEEIIVAGSVGSINCGSGDVECADVTGNVSTQSGDIDCHDIGGNVSTMSGDVNSTGIIHGEVSTMSGDIKYRK